MGAQAGEFCGFCREPMNEGAVSCRACGADRTVVNVGFLRKLVYLVLFFLGLGLASLSIGWGLVYIFHTEPVPGLGSQPLPVRALALAAACGITYLYFRMINKFKDRGRKKVLYFKRS
jgi:hypothetical protein